MLPSLNKRQTFSLVISVMPHNNCSHDVIIGQQVMRDLNLNISIIKNEFTWKELTIPFVNRGYWTTEHISQFCQSHFPKKNQPAVSFDDKVQVMGEGTQVNDVFITAGTKQTMKKVSYKATDLPAIVAGINYLDDSKKGILLSTLSKYLSVFEGKCGNWKGEEKSI